MLWKVPFWFIFLIRAACGRTGVATPQERHNEPDVLWLLSQRLRQLRRARGLTQEMIGERGFSYKYYQRIESGRVNVTIRTLARLAAVLGVPLVALLHFPASTGSEGEHGQEATET